MYNIVFWILLILTVIKVPLAYAASAPGLGAATNFSVLGALSASSANTTTLSGNLGLSPGLAVSRTGSWIVGGSEYFGTSSLAATAQTDALNAFNNLTGQSSDGLWAGNTSPTPGVWTVASDVTFNGTITLNGGYNDVWVFQIGRDMTFSGSVVLTGNAQPCHVFWQIGRSATIASGSTFVGTLIASVDITAVSSATVNGRLISLNSSLTLDANNVSDPVCQAAPTETPTPTSTPTPTTAESPTPTPTTAESPTPTPTSTSTPTSTPTTAESPTPTPTPTSTSSSTPTSNSTQSNAPASVYCPPFNDQIVTPLIVESKRVDADSVFIKWGPYSGIDKFNVLYGFEKEKLLYNTDVTGFSTTINALHPNQPIWVRIAAKDNCQIGDYGEPKLVGGPGLPNTGVFSGENNVFRYVLCGIVLIFVFLLKRIIENNLFVDKNIHKHLQ